MTGHDDQALADPDRTLRVLVFVISFGLASLVLPKGRSPFEPTPAFFLLTALFAAVGAIGFVWYGSVKLPGRTWRELGWHTDGIGGQFEDTWAVLVNAGRAPRAVRHAPRRPSSSRSCCCARGLLRAPADPHVRFVRTCRAVHRREPA